MYYQDNDIFWQGRSFAKTFTAAGTPLCSPTRLQESVDLHHYQVHGRSLSGKKEAIIFFINICPQGYDQGEQLVLKADDLIEAGGVVRGWQERQD